MKSHKKTTQLATSKVILKYGERQAEWKASRWGSL